MIFFFSINVNVVYTVFENFRKIFFCRRTSFSGEFFSMKKFCRRYFSGIFSGKKTVSRRNTEHFFFFVSRISFFRRIFFMKNFCFSSISYFFQENFFQRKLFLFQKKDLLLRINILFLKKMFTRKKKFSEEKDCFFSFSKLTFVANIYSGVISEKNNNNSRSDFLLFKFFSHVYACK